MSTPTSTLERAFEIAGSGRCKGMDQLRRQLHVEGHRDHERALFGLSLRRQLQALMATKPAPKAA